LGKRYDPVLSRFSEQVKRVAEVRIALPRHMRIPTEPCKLIRAIVGHLLAARSYFSESVLEKAMRRYFLDEAATEPEGFSVFYWFYRFSDVVVVPPCIAMPARRGCFEKFADFGVLKFYPLGFAVSSLTDYEGLPSVGNYVNDDALPFDMGFACTKDWPNDACRENFVAYGDGILDSATIHPENRTRNAGDSLFLH